jgi:RNA polymerase sigma-70 factor, ECF subfamily
MINEADDHRKAHLDAYVTEIWCRDSGPIRYYFRRRFTDPGDAEDMMQTTFERLYSKLLNSPEEQPEAAITNIQSYLFAIARNVYLEWQRKRNSVIFISDTISEDVSFFDALADLGPTPEESVLGQEQIHDLYERIEQLPEVQRNVLWFVSFRGMTPKKTSETLGLSEYTVYRHLRDAKKHLRMDLLSYAESDEEPSSTSLTEQEPASTESQINTLNERKSVSGPPQLASAIALLAEPYRSVLTLAMLERYKYTQIAALRGCSVGTIKGQVSRGRRLLRSVQRPAQASVYLSPQIPITSRELPYLDALPEKHRILLTLREIQGCSYAQIAAHLQISLAYVKKRLHCARMAYRALLDQQPRRPWKVSRRKTIPLDELSRLNHPAYCHFYEALYLAYVDHLSDKEIAARLHRPVNTIKAHIARGIKLLTPVEPQDGSLSSA